jgi:purine nucleoside permease
MGCWIQGAKCWAFFAFFCIALPGQPALGGAAPLPIRVVVVTTFEVGRDSGDAKGEFQNWVERYPLPDTLPFPQGFRPLRYNAREHVLGIVTGVGKSHAAASIMALGLDPRFDLSKAYWILAGIAGIDPAIASIGSAAWATRVIDGDLAYEIDGREVPAEWSTGILPYDRYLPYQSPAPPGESENGVQVFHLNDGLVGWAYGLTRDLALPDDAKLQAARAAYADFPEAQKPPFVLRGDTITADRFWLGAALTRWAEQWVGYWTGGEGKLGTAAEEDTGYLQAMTFLAKAGRVDWKRVLDLRTGSDFTMPPKGMAPADFLKTEAKGDYAAYAQSIESAYLVGSPVVRELAGHWARYRNEVP